MEILKEKYGKNSVSEIRRAQLLEDCNDRICKATRGKIDTYGGSFERSLKYLEGLRALKCVKRGKKLTVVVPDLKRVEDLLTNYKINGTIDDINGTILQRKIEDDLWERTVENETNLAVDEKTSEIIEKLDIYLPVKDKTKKTETHLLLKEITGKITSHVVSRLLEFYVQHQDDNFQLGEDIIVDLGIAARKIARYNLKAPFKVIMEYNGFPETGVKLGHMVGPAISKMIGENFMVWAIKIMHHKFSKEDEGYLSKGRFDLLSPIVKGYYEEIYQPLLQYYSNLFNK